MQSPLILASSSPQRKQLLEGLGIPFDVRPSSIHEPAHPEESPAARAQDLARLKAEDVAALYPGRFVLGADTLVVSSEGALLEKPSDADDARRMLRAQNDSVSIVHSALCLIAPDGTSGEGIDSSRVYFNRLSDDDIEWWIGTNLWKDRSGAFQIDGPGQLMIKRIEGDWTGIVGLPIFLFGELARMAKLPLPSPPPQGEGIFYAWGNR